MTSEVRRLRADELPLATPLLAPEGWALEPADLARLHGLGGAVGAFDDGRLVGFLTFVDTPPYRWIGNVAVAPDQRGRGTGGRLTVEAMRGAERTALYSVEKAIPLYERAGLRTEGSLQALRAERGRAVGTGAPRATVADVDGMVALDREVVAMDRSALLRALAASFPSWIVRDGDRVEGFAIAKTYADVTEIGPIVARTPAAAASLLDGALSTSGPHELAAHATNAAFLTLARGRGFEPTFRPTPMFHGGSPKWDVSRYHAVAGLEKG